MDQIEVYVVDLEAIETGLQRTSRLLITVVVVEALRGDEHLIAIHISGVDRLADASLVAVRSRRVEVSVAREQRAGDGFRRVLWRNLKDAEPELRDHNVVVQSHVGNPRELSDEPVLIVGDRGLQRADRRFLAQCGVGSLSRAVARGIGRVSRAIGRRPGLRARFRDELFGFGDECVLFRHRPQI